MRVQTKVGKMGHRRICEVPKAVRDNFEIGETVYIVRVCDLERVTQTGVSNVGTENH